MFEKLMADYCRLTYVKQWEKEGSRIRITLPWAEDCFMIVTSHYIFKETIRLLEDEAATVENDGAFYGWYDDAADKEYREWADNIRAAIRQYKNWWYKKGV